MLHRRRTGRNTRYRLGWPSRRRAQRLRFAIVQCRSACAKAGPRRSLRRSAERPARAAWAALRLLADVAIGATMELGRSWRTLLLMMLLLRPRGAGEPPGHRQQGALKDQRFRARVNPLAPSHPSDTRTQGPSDSLWSTGYREDFWARQTARDLAAIGGFGRPFTELAAGERATVEGTDKKAGLVRWCTFHPAYGYEDFIEGFRPQVNSAKQLVFERCPGIFKALCADAGNDSEQRKYFLVVDEINRGDIPRIFGELLTLLEKDKRGLEVTLPLSGDRFTVPRNVYVLGTMNTADRSIALLDTALRRRFGFVELMPDISVLGAASAGGSIPLGLWLAALNDRLRTHLGRDARNLQIGHAYLLEDGHPVTDFTRFVQILAEDLVPLLEEYCYEDYGALAQILGSGLVDAAGQRIRQELFSPGKKAELVQALIEPAPDIVTASAATNAEEPEEIAAEDPEETAEAEESKV